MLQKALRTERSSPALEALLTQLAATVLALLVPMAGVDLTALEWAAVQGAIALRIATLARAEPWWLVIHLGFAPAAVFVASIALPPVVWAGAFAVFALVFGQTHRTRVPLYLAGRRVRDAMRDLLPRGRTFTFVDLGCGLGGMLAHLRRARPEGHFDGAELAWLPYFVARLRGLVTGFWVERKDLMAVDLGRYDVVYAFLSPHPMAALWEKARREMRPGSVFVSVAFEVPGVAASEVLRLSNSPRHALHVFRM